ncbi:MAG: cell division protein FtsZ [Tidjanibacter sp.]|nr:cell division protein FtsZ [Tidjanibacter sp.]
MEKINTDDFLGGIQAPAKAESIIMALGVGGAGGNAVNHMYDMGIKDVSYMICNTDRQALQSSPIDNKIQLGAGLGAGNDPRKGRQAAIETLDDIMIQLENSGVEMIFITAGMGGGTGTGAAPVIAKAAKAKGILTVGIVTMPFRTEGQQRTKQALEGLKELSQNVDSLVVIHNDNINKIYGSLPFKEALGKADDIVATAARGIAELVTRPGLVNVDMNDVKTVMTQSGMALMGAAFASGDNKIDSVVEAALSSPLLNHQDIRGAKQILLNITYNDEKSITFDDTTRIVELVQKRASKSVHGNEANIIWGAGEGEVTGGDIELTIVATGFDQIDAQPTSTARQPFDNELKPAIDKPSASGVKWNISNRYANIESTLMQAAYFRRGMQLTGTTAKGAAVQIEKSDEGQHKAKKDDTPSLF